MSKKKSKGFIPYFEAMCALASHGNRLDLDKFHGLIGAGRQQIATYYFLRRMIRDEVLRQDDNGDYLFTREFLVLLRELAKAAK